MWERLRTALRNRKLRRSDLLKFLLLILLSCGFAPTVRAIAPDKDDRLHLIRRIYIEPTPAVDVVPKQVTQLEPLLKFELERRGFVVVASAAESDAMLLGEGKAEIVLHGDGSIPPKSIYEYRLVVPGGHVVWKTGVKFISRKTLAEDYEYAARAVAERLTSDWQRAAKKAAKRRASG